MRLSDKKKLLLEWSGDFAGREWMNVEDMWRNGSLLLLHDR